MSTLTENLRGCVVRQLYHGIPYLVFVEHADGSKPRAVCLVRAVEGPSFTYATDGTRMDWQGDGTEDACELAAQYLAEVKPH